MWLEDFWPVSVGGRAVGKLTSASYSPRLEINMGYAWLPIASASHGTRIEIASPSGTLGAEVVPLPFWDASKDVPKA
jgi:glycine cleavage system aminomethyltransferase T